MKKGLKSSAARPKGPKTKACKAESGVGFLEGGS